MAPLSAVLALASVLLLASSPPSSAAASYPRTEALLDRAAAEVTQLAAAAESRHASAVLRQPRRAECAAFSACADDIPDRYCDKNYGSTVGCECQGRSLTETAFTVKTSPEASTEDEALNAVCYTEGLQEDFAQSHAADTEDTFKWRYYGSREGVLVNYPGFLWQRDFKSCGGDYDPTFRPWYVQGASGPKNVVIILDRSGSMDDQGRMGAAIDAAMTVIDGLTHVDNIAIVAFSDYIETPYTYLVPALEPYRDQLKKNFVKDLYPNGGTEFGIAFERAFTILKRSVDSGIYMACQTSVVFLTDGDPSDSTDPTSVFSQLSRQYVQETGQSAPALFVYTFGSGANKITASELACKSDGFYSHVDDGGNLRKAMAHYFKAITFSREANSQQPVTFSEPYNSIPNIWGPVSTAVSPVYDKSKSPWHLLGVVAVDVPVCELEAAAQLDLNDNPPPRASYPVNTQRGCVCESSYQYDGKSYNKCTTDHWTIPWCGVGPDCGICDGSVSPGGCWDECETQLDSASAVVEHLLKSRSTQCAYTPPTDCEMEALRGENTCGSCSGSSDERAAARRLSTEYVFTGTNEAKSWNHDAFPETVGKELCGSANDPNDDCPSCSATMLPTCAYSHCEDALDDARRERRSTACCADVAVADCGGTDGCAVCSRYVESDDFTYEFCGREDQCSGGGGGGGGGSEGGALGGIIAGVVISSLGFRV